MRLFQEGSRTMRRPLIWLSVLAVLALALAGCGKDDKKTSSGAANGATSTTQALQGNLNVFAAASLTEAFNDVKADLAKTAPDLKLTYNFAGSQALVTQIMQGAPADVFASADQKNMDKLVSANLVETPVVFARNKL